MIAFGDGRIEIRREIAATHQQLWEIITDTEKWSRWGPSVVDVDCVMQQITAGSRGRVKTVFGVWLPFVVTKYSEPYYWRWKIGAVEATGHRLTKIADNKCLLAFDMPWWAMFYLPVCYLALRRIEDLCRSAGVQR